MSESDRTVSRAGGQGRTALPPVRVPVPSVRPPRRRPALPALRGTGRGPGILTIVTWTTLTLAIVLFVVIAIGPRTGAYRLQTVLSDSMRPHWQAGDVVLSTPIAARDLAAGDVITFTAPVDGRPSITHRIVSIEASGDDPVIRTKGDANDAEDTWGAIRLDGQGTVYRVDRAIPKLGLGLIWLQKPIVRLIATAIIPMLLLVLILWHIWKPVVRPPHGVRA